MGPVVDRVFAVLLTVHLSANVVVLVSSILAFLYRQSPYRLTHRRAGRLFALSLIISFLAGLSMIAIRTVKEGLVGSQGFSGAVNMYFAFVACSGTDFLSQAIVVARWGWTSWIHIALPVFNIFFGIAILINFGIEPEILATDPPAWKSFDPVVGVFTPIYILLEARNVLFHTPGTPLILKGVPYHEGVPLQKRVTHHRHHVINIMSCVAIVFSIFFGDLCINRFWNLGLILSSYGGVRLVLVTAFTLPHLLPIHAWLFSPQAFPQWQLFSKSSHTATDPQARGHASYGQTYQATHIEREEQYGDARDVAAAAEDPAYVEYPPNVYAYPPLSSHASEGEGGGDEPATRSLRCESRTVDAVVSIWGGGDNSVLQSSNATTPVAGLRAPGVSSTVSSTGTARHVHHGHSNDLAIGSTNVSNYGTYTSTEDTDTK